MKIVIPSRLTNLEIIKQLSDLLEGYGKLTEKESNNISSLEGYLDDKAYDYVKEFINITDDTKDDDTVNYLVNCFYRAKGTLEIFNMMTKYLNVIFREPDRKSVV